MCRLAVSYICAAPATSFADEDIESSAPGMDGGGPLCDCSIPAIIRNVLKPGKLFQVSNFFVD